MVETKTAVIYGIIGVLLLGGLGTYILTPEQLANARTCTTNNVTGIFERFSSSNVTAYWTENSTQKSALCSKGKWMTYAVNYADVTASDIEQAADDALKQTITFKVVPVSTLGVANMKSSSLAFSTAYFTW